MEFWTAPMRCAFAQEVTLFHREAGEVQSSANGIGGWMVSPLLATGTLAAAALWPWSAGAAAGGHSLGAGQRPPVPGHTSRDGYDVPRAEFLRLENPMSPCKIWIEQCQTARGIEAKFGTQKALACSVGFSRYNRLRYTSERQEHSECLTNLFEIPQPITTLFS